MLASSELVAFVASTDARLARGFYGERLGLPLIDETEFACVFQAQQTLLCVAIVDEVVNAPYTVPGPQADRD